MRAWTVILTIIGISSAVQGLDMPRSKRKGLPAQGRYREKRVSESDAPSANAADLPFPTRPKIKSDTPIDGIEPTVEMVQAVSELQHYSELFVSGIEKLLGAMQASGELERAAVLGQDNDRRYPAPVVLQWKDYSPLAQLVLRAGHTFEVNEEGKPFIRQLKAIDYTEEDIDFTTVISLALANSCEDNAIIWAMTYGARSHSDPPKNSVFFPNHAGARKNPEGVQAVLEPEIEKEWVTVSASPTNVPIGARPISIVPKTAVVEGVIVITGYRLITDGSYPDKKRRNAHVRDEDGVLRPLAPNFNFTEGSQPDVRYTSIAEISVALQPLMAAAEQAQTRWSSNATISRSGSDKYI